MTVLAIKDIVHRRMQNARNRHLPAVNSLIAAPSPLPPKLPDRSALGGFQTKSLMNPNFLKSVALFWLDIHLCAGGRVQRVCRMCQISRSPETDNYTETQRDTGDTIHKTLECSKHHSQGLKHRDLFGGAMAGMSQIQSSTDIALWHGVGMGCRAVKYRGVAKVWEGER